MLDEENCSDCIFFFLSEPHFENSSLVCHVTVDHQIPVTACHLFLFILASKEHERSSADIYIKKVDLRCGMMTKSRDKCRPWSSQGQGPGPSSHVLCVELYTECSFTAKLWIWKRWHKVKGVVWPRNDELDVNHPLKLAALLSFTEIYSESLLIVFPSGPQLYGFGSISPLS